VTEAPSDIDEIKARIQELGPWFHNLKLRGIDTAPSHFLGDYPTVKWSRFSSMIEPDLRGKSVLDIGCNAGFFSLEMKRRGADYVLGIDSDENYLAQARFAAEVEGLEVELRNLSVYDIAKIGQRFDIVLFMGVLYHLRYPLLALDLIREHVAEDLLIFQSMQRGSQALPAVDENYDFWRADIFEQSGYPKLHFVEHRYADDWTNWWIPNRACAEAMLRSAGFEILAHPEEEVYVCRGASVPYPLPALNIMGGHP
jgi:tRNA (mo5U34)-methyltransferase